MPTHTYIFTCTLSRAPDPGCSREQSGTTPPGPLSLSRGEAGACAQGGSKRHRSLSRRHTATAMDNEQPLLPVARLAHRVRGCPAVVFDLDGTLVDSLWVWDQVDREFFERHHISPSEELLKEMDTVDYSKRANILKQRTGLGLSMAEIKRQWYQGAETYYKEKLKLKPGAREFIDWLTSHNIPIGLATANTPHLTMCFLENNGIKEKFSVVKTTSEVPHTKPAPDVYLAAMKELGVKKEDCVVFEDSVVGVQAALGTGAHVIHIRDNYSKDQWEKLESQTEFSIVDYRELVNELNNIDKRTVSESR